MTAGSLLKKIGNSLKGNKQPQAPEQSRAAEPTKTVKSHSRSRSTRTSPRNRLRSTTSRRRRNAGVQTPGWGYISQHDARCLHIMASWPKKRHSKKRISRSRISELIALWQGKLKVLPPRAKNDIISGVKVA